MDDVKIELSSRTKLKGHADGTNRSGARLDLLLDALTTAQASGAPAGSNVVVEHMGGAVVITWEEDR